ncbi:MAG: P-II family nitrogen regulator [Coriobacteriia bacterium]|nr:P-II family nitrogen regulator [Coriobacteriia bacterium]
MKRIEAVIRSEKMQEVKQALIDSGHAEMTFSNVQGHTAEKPITSHFRGQQYTVDLLPQVAVVVMAHDHDVRPVVDVIRQHARTDHTGDGQIFVTSVDQIISVRTGEVGVGAL